MKRIIAVIIAAFMLVMALTSCNESIGTSEGVSEPSASSSSESESSYTESSDVENSFSESSTDETSDEIPNDTSMDVFEMKLNLESESEGAYIAYSADFVSDMSLYSHFGETEYVYHYHNGVDGTARVKNGIETAFYPRTYNMYEYNGEIYGILTEGEAYVDFIGHYCRFYEDGTYKVLMFEETYVFYRNDKIYFIDYVPSKTEGEEGKFALCRANIDGTGKKTLAANLPESVDTNKILFYKDYVILSGRGFYTVSPEGKINTLLEDNDDYYYSMQFVNNGYLYYTKKIEERFGVNSKPSVRHSLLRVPLNGGESEQLLSVTVKGTRGDCIAAAFDGKLLVFLSDGVYVYTDNLKDSKFYNYTGFKYDKIYQITVNGDLMSVTTGLDTFVYDTKGNVVLNSENITHQSESAPEKNIIANPLLFWDTTDYRPGQAYIIGAFNKDGFHTTREFPYNDRHLNDYIEDVDGETVETNIIDTSKTLTFYDRYGSFFEADCGKIRCYSETIIGEAHICADVESDIPIDSRRFLGTYNGVDIFPESIEYNGNSITVDLDCDGDDETIRWSFEKDDGVYSDRDYYYYTLEAVVDGKKVAISDNKDWIPLEKGDFEVFIADVDMDGNYEVLVYEKGTSIFSDILIYDVSAKESELLHYYTIHPMP